MQNKEFTFFTVNCQEKDLYGIDEIGEWFLDVTERLFEALGLIKRVDNGERTIVARQRILCAPYLWKSCEFFYSMHHYTEPL